MFWSISLLAWGLFGLVSARTQGVYVDVQQLLNSSRTQYATDFTRDIVPVRSSFIPPNIEIYTLSQWLLARCPPLYRFILRCHFHWSRCLALKWDSVHRAWCSITHPKSDVRWLVHRASRTNTHECKSRHTIHWTGKTRSSVSTIHTTWLIGEVCLTGMEVRLCICSSMSRQMDNRRGLLSYKHYSRSARKVGWPK